MKAIDLLKELIELTEKAAAGNVPVATISHAIKALAGEDFVVFKNGVGGAFDIWVGTKVVDAILNHKDGVDPLFCYVHFAKLGDTDYIMNRPSIHPRYGLIDFVKP